MMKQNTKKEPKEVKRKDWVIRRNLDRIRVSAAPPLPSNPSRHSQVSLAENVWKNSLLLRKIDEKIKEKKKLELEWIKRIMEKNQWKRNVRGTKMSGRTQTDRFQELLPRLKRSNMYKLPEFHQRGITVHPASGYGTNIMQWKTKKEPKEVKAKMESSGGTWRGCMCRE